MTGIIHAYYDFVSPYSYFAFVHLQRLRGVLASHGVSVEIHPIFLGGIMNGSGNTPPWQIAAKSKYGQLELRRAIRYFDVPPFEPPSFFPILTILPLRAITYIKQTQTRETFEAVFGLYWKWFFYQHRDLSKPDVLQTCLLEEFSAEQVRAIMHAAGERKWKDELTARTQEALDRGAFGAPFFWVVKTPPSSALDGEGEGAAFWGSDRFHHMWDFLGLPWDDFKLHASSDAKL
ncbi:hypothetical protein UA08_07763 [Talaromyces atroroseus]|uniref:Glutathione S-transferase kappa n=1 Tax=Talaromyces atroroseus TaxID=1441469 RepID=A0A225AR18_TALAT|nr:hypothetical protein UA08_07763 [Talaromyces atroroseus]OKL56875.1 hypothetical protein UA08_07763 [Talaromyces atroroseus]